MGIRRWVARFFTESCSGSKGGSSKEGLLGGFEGKVKRSVRCGAGQIKHRARCESGQRKRKIRCESGQIKRKIRCESGQIKRKVRCDAGQMTVEFAVAFPVMIVVAVIAVNVMLFFSECAVFDRVARDSVRIYATSPAYGQSSEQSRSLVAQTIDQVMDKDYLSCSVALAGSASGYVTYTATMSFSPTLFGMGFKSEVFGVALPALQHSTSMTVDVYKSGVIA